MVESNTIESKDIVDPHWSGYLNVLKENNIFTCVQNKSVLELAANGGWHSRLIYENNPEKLVCVEPDIFFCEPLYDTFASQHKNIECFWDTYNEYIQKEKEKFDVVVCCGLLYHLHSPLDCMEKIINIHQPKTLIIENFDVDYEHLNEEDLNLCGNAFTDNTKHIPYNFFIPMRKWKEILSKVGYNCIKEYKWSDYGVTHSSKEPAVMMIFENE